jgi:hypothetical protein
MTVLPLLILDHARLLVDRPALRLTLADLRRASCFAPHMVVPGPSTLSPPTRAGVDQSSRGQLRA